jgi:glutathione S-transferase
VNELCIYVGNKNYSSWSLRAWMVLKQTGADFQEVIIPLDQGDSRKRLRACSPSGRVPVLRHGDLTIWESLAIAEYLAELFPAARLWPESAATRAIARAVSAEMHAGFPALRTHLPLDMRGRYSSRKWPAEVTDDIHRIIALWSDCRQRFGNHGDYLFGAFTIADAMYAPVVSRFVSYGVTLDGIAAAYRDAVWAWPALQEWFTAAAAEPWVMKT